MDDEAALDVATVHSTIVIADPFYFERRNYYTYIYVLFAFDSIILE